MGSVILGGKFLILAKTGLIAGLIFSSCIAAGNEQKVSFFPIDTNPPVIWNKTGNKIHYTILICTLDHLITDPFFGGRNKIQIVRMGDLYRYIFSEYGSLEEARKDLAMVRKIYPYAYIREFYQGKLGQAFDMIIDHSEYKNTKL